MYLKRHPIINGLIYVPLHLAVLLYLFKVLSNLPETLTEMNKSFILHTVYRGLAKCGSIPDGINTEVDSFETLSSENPAVFNTLCKSSELVFLGLQKDQLVFTYSELSKCYSNIDDLPGDNDNLNGFGLLQAVQHFSRKGPGTTASFNVLHFTMQEFLAAFYISRLPHQEQSSLIQETFWEGKYNFMWMMYAGINGISSAAFNQFLYKSEENDSQLILLENIAFNKLKCLHLFQCFMEAKSEVVPKDISCLFQNGEIGFRGIEGGLHPQHISSLLFYFSKYDIQIKTLDFRDCNIGDTGMNLLQQFFATYPEKAITIQNIDLFGNKSDILWKVYCTMFERENLKQLDWSSLGGVDIKEIVTVLHSNTVIESLNISNNHLKDHGAKEIANILNHNATLQELDISNNDMSTNGALAISESLRCNTTLQYIVISWNTLQVGTKFKILDLSGRTANNSAVQIIAGILFHNKTVDTLDLSNNKISDGGALYLSDCFKNNSYLKEINISGNDISSEGMKKIANSLQVNCSIEKLDVSHNNISNNGAIAISECLENNNTLQYINMSGNGISNVGAEHIGDAIENNTAIKTVDISFNGISNFVRIGKALKKFNNATIKYFT